jgi:hypothetical protein
MVTRIAMLLCVCVCLVPQVDARAHIYTGYAARYRPGLMGEVADNRGIARTSCMVAATYEGIGTWVRVTGLTTRSARLCRVVDVPRDSDRGHLVARRIVIELDHTSAGIVCGSTREPPRSCPVEVSTP